MLTSARVDIKITDNATFQDAFQFGTTGDTSWSLTGQLFKMEVKASRDDISPLITFTSGAGQIVVDSTVLRVLHMNVSDITIQNSLPPADYVYDFVMYDTSVPPIRTVLMHGALMVRRGVSED